MVYAHEGGVAGDKDLVLFKRTVEVIVALGDLALEFAG